LHTSIKLPFCSFSFPLVCLSCTQKSMGKQAWMGFPSRTFVCLYQRPNKCVIHI
jgi:hypothetical protein